MGANCCWRARGARSVSCPRPHPTNRPTSVFVIYDLLASFAGAAGALFGGSIGLWGALGLAGASASKPLFLVYAAIGLLNLVLFNRLSDKVELARVEGQRKFLGIDRSRGTSHDGAAFTVAALRVPFFFCL